MLKRKLFGTPLCATAAVAAMVLLAAAPAHAQPPAQGPAPATVNSDSVTSDLITGEMMLTINQKVADENAALAKSQSYHATISAAPERWSPFMTQTPYLDHPNEFFADVPHIITYTVSDISANVHGVWVSYPFSRTITQTVDVHVSCEGWQNGNGVLTVTSVMQPAALDGDHSFPEDAIGFLLLNVLPAYVDTQIAQQLSSFPVGSIVTQTQSSCNTLGVATHAQGFPLEGVNFDHPAERIGGSGLAVGSVLNQPISVRVVSVTRLTLHDSQGPVYQVVETPHLDFWAGWSHIQFNLPPMVEGQTWVPGTRATIQTPVPSNNSRLVLIGSLTYDEIATEDSSWAVYGKNTNYGNGTQNFNEPKTWFEANPLPGGKPVKLNGAGYQVTVQISAPGTSTAPGPVNTGNPSVGGTTTAGNLP